MVGGISVEQAGLLESPGADGPSSLGVPAVAKAVSSCHAVAANVSFI